MDWHRKEALPLKRRSFPSCGPSNIIPTLHTRGGPRRLPGFDLSRSTDLEVEEDHVLVPHALRLPCDVGDLGGVARVRCEAPPARDLRRPLRVPRWPRGLAPERPAGAELAR
eukprot:1178418-Prorocentrum_minimum.AAC.4